MDVNEAAKILGVKRHAVYQYRRQGRIRANLASNGHFDFSEEDVRAMALARKPKDEVPAPSLLLQMTELLGYDALELRSPSKLRRISDKRKVVALLMRYEGMSYQEIADQVNRKRNDVIAMIRNSFPVKDEFQRAFKIWTSKSDSTT